MTSSFARVFQCAVVAVLGVFVVQAEARDSELMFPIADVVNAEKYAGKLDDSIDLYFGDQSYPAPERKLGEFSTNKKTNAFGKSDTEACEWVMLSALISLQERAVREGGDAVVNIRSYYKQNEVSSETEYECHAGNVIAGVALIGRLVNLKD